MNFIKYFLGTALILLLLPSCEDKLELFPPNQKIPEYNRIEDFEQTLVGAYGSWTAGGAFGANLLSLDCWLGDDMIISPQNNGQGAFLHNWTYSDGDGTMSGSWARLYRGATRCNIILEEQGNIDDPEMERIVAEATVLRAMSHLYLYSLFGERYGDGSSMGVPYVTSSNILLQPERLSSRETLDRIEEDLLAAQPVINDVNANVDVYTVNPGLVEGLLARVAMFREDWTDVINHTTNVIDNYAPPLAPEATYSGMWDGRELDGENIFKIAFTVNDAQIGDLFWIISLNAPYFNPSRDIVDLFLEGANDVRYTQFFDPEASGNPYERVWKYRGNTSNPNIADAKVMRTSEMYLLRAEAHAMQGNAGMAAADIQAVRDIRIRGGGLPVDQGNILDELILERRKELCYEGFRVFDLKRWNLPIERDQCTAVNCTLPADCYIFVFPIPADELFANDNITQNPGWADLETACYE